MTWRDLPEHPAIDGLPEAPRDEWVFSVDETEEGEEPGPLRSVWIWRTPDVAAEVVSEILATPTLKRVRIDGPLREVGPGDLPHETLRGLEELEVETLSAFDDAALAAALASPRLRVLKLDTTAVTEEGLLGLGSSEAAGSLEVLSHASSPISPAVLEPIGKLEKLRELHLPKVEPVAAGMLEPVGGLRELRRLHVPMNTYDDDRLQQLSGLKQLETLTLRTARKVTDAGVDALLGMEALSELAMYDPLRIGDDGLSRLAGHPELETLQMTLEMETAGLSGPATAFGLDFFEHIRITEEGLDRTRSENPGTEIELSAIA